MSSVKGRQSGECVGFYTPGWDTVEEESGGKEGVQRCNVNLIIFRDKEQNQQFIGAKRHNRNQ